MKLQLASYNISHGIDYSEMTGDIDSWDRIDLHKTAALIRHISADIVALQEVYDGKTPATADQTNQLAKAAGYPYRVFAKGTTFPWGETIGNCILSKYPILLHEALPILAPKESERDPDENEWFEDRVILKATIHAGIPIDVITTHFGLNPSEKKRMEQVLLPLIDRAPRPTVLLGDLNAMPHSSVLYPYRKRLCSAADCMGKTDHPTFSSFAPDKTLDYIFLSNEFRVSDYNVVHQIVSDHFPITATVTL